MRYQHSLAIHQRLESVLGLIRAGKYSTPALAEAIGVSIPTISRIVAALRERGHDIRAERHDGGWRYVLVEERSPRSRGKRSNAAAGKGRRPDHHDD
jgi:predicted DNA-binding transcriptional regulator YafY